MITNHILGNGTVLYASLNNTLKIDNISLLFVQNIAVTDIVITLLFYLPMLPTLCARHWVLGDTLCYISAMFLRSIPRYNEVIVISVLSVFRLWVINKPRGVRDGIPLYRVKLLMLGLLVLSAYPGLSLTVLGCTGLFVVHFINCLPSMECNSVILRGVNAVLFTGSPLFLVWLSNISIMVILFKQSHKFHDAVNRSTITLLLCICWAFSLAYTPFCIVSLLKLCGIHGPMWLDLVGVYMTSINVIVNPVVYTIKNREFRGFLERRFRRISVKKRVGNSQNVIINTTISCSVDDIEL